MQPGEIIVARLSGGVTLGRYLSSASRQGERIRMSLGRNREAKIPVGRVIFSTGVIASTVEEVLELRRRCEGLASEIDLSEVWEVVRDQPAPVDLDELSELHWGAGHDVAHRIALLLHLERNSLYFVEGSDGYSPRSEEAVQEILARRRREDEQGREATALVERLALGGLPTTITKHQSDLLGYLRGYAVFGEDYTRGGPARALLQQIETGTRDLQRRSFELLTEAGVLAADEPLELERAGIPIQFSEEALAEASAVDASLPLAGSRRKDLTALAAVTVDDAGTVDRDDAVHLEVEPPDNGGGGREERYRIGVHVTDAGALIPMGGALDREADRRMATVYLPETKVAMLPPLLSNEKGSLDPGQDRAALSLLVSISESAEVLHWELVTSVVRSVAALSYEEADLAIGDASHRYHDMLSKLSRLARRLRTRREEKGAVRVDRPEMLVKVGPSGEVKVRVLSRLSPARTMVAELMILCNSLLAQHCRGERLSAAFRSQPSPDLSDVDAELPDGPLRWYLVMRRLPPSELSTVAAPHGGLGLPEYIQATSPLRRYPDLVMQRQISHYLSTGRPLYSPEAVASVAQRADVQLKELGRLENERKTYWFLKYLRQELSLRQERDEPLLYEAVILARRPGRPALLELVQYPHRVRADLPPRCAPGDTVTLRLHGVDLWRRVGEFVYEHGEA